MPINTSSYINFGKAITSGQEATVNNTTINNEKTLATTTNSNSKTSESATDNCDCSNTSKFLQQLESAISTAPAIDLEKITATANSLKNGKLDILNANITARLNSAEKIAAALLETNIIK